MGFVENLILFLTVQKLWKLVRIWQSYHRLCNVLFYGPRCIIKGTCYRMRFILPCCPVHTVFMGKQVWFYLKISIKNYLCY